MVECLDILSKEIGNRNDKTKSPAVETIDTELKDIYKRCDFFVRKQKVLFWEFLRFQGSFEFWDVLCCFWIFPLSQIWKFAIPSKM